MQRKGYVRIRMQAVRSCPADGTVWKSLGLLVRKDYSSFFSGAVKAPGRRD